MSFAFALILRLKELFGLILYLLFVYFEHFTTIRTSFFFWFNLHEKDKSNNCYLLVHIYISNSLDNLFQAQSYLKD